MCDSLASRPFDLRDNGVNYIICSILGGSRATLRRFAREMMPEFSDQVSARTAAFAGVESAV